MANYYSAQYANSINSSPKVFTPVAQWGGKVVRYLATYTVPVGGIASGSVLYCFRPAKGCRMTGLGAVMNDADLTNNTTLQVGIVGATDKFLAATNHGGGAAVKTALLPAAKAAALDYEFDGVTDVVIVTGTGTAAAAAVISLEMFFATAK